MDIRVMDNGNSFGIFEPCEQTDDNATQHLEVQFRGGLNANSQINNDDMDDDEYYQQSNTCRILQRKLELKVEKAKRHYSQHQDICSKKSQSSSLIPINRLHIPGSLENQPLVDYKSESDDQEEISFFPVKLKGSKRQQELSDTFSIQEMTIESENSDESDISPNLELLPPRLKTNLFDRVLNCFYCVHGEV